MISNGQVIGLAKVVTRAKQQISRAKIGLEHGG
jgi:hypothetical protein